MEQICIIQENKYIRSAWTTFINYETDLEVVCTFQSIQEAISSNTFFRGTLFLCAVEPGEESENDLKKLLQKAGDRKCIYSPE
jgi:hypothetical protein